MEDNFPWARERWGMVQAAMKGQGEAKKLGSLTAHHFLCGPDPNRLQTGTSPLPRGCGTLP